MERLNMASEVDPAGGGEGAKILKITGPLDEATTRSLRVGDVVKVDGVIWGLRDATLIRMFDEGVLPPVDLSGALLLHTAPSVRIGADGSFEPISVGTTTSMRMDRFSEGCVGQLGARAIIGKGGLSRQSGESLAAAGAVYLSPVGGAASPMTLQIEAIEEAYYLDLMPECLWKFRVSDFGPLFVTMDTVGNSNYEKVAAIASANLSQAYRMLDI